MTRNTKPHIFVIDDDQMVREAVCNVLKQKDWKVTSFASAVDCLNISHFQDCDLIISDVKMPDVSGMELLTEVKRRAPWLPVLLMTAYGDIPMTAKAFKKGTDDFLEKPLDRHILISAVKAALWRITPRDPLLGKLLTKAEKHVLRLIMDGMSNKEAAYSLSRSVRTVEVHRTRIMAKLGVNNLVDLVKRAYEMGLVEPLTQ